ncbi:hypothetical protein [Halomonas sp. 11-S5]|uniref:hypothetical protein n=1 Tax=Halomonas sp. 11-S5 TaxID=2994064 RepID=UPI002468F2B6|nr:hypothetical protein [Halomonas sp. 11-S5]
MNESNESRRILALNEVNAFVSFLRSRGLEAWAKRYEVLSRALAEGNIQHAVAQEKSIPKGGMGGLTDLYICKENGHKTENPENDNETLMKHIGQVSQAFSQLRKQLKGYVR